MRAPGSEHPRREHDFMSVGEGADPNDFLKVRLRRSIRNTLSRLETRYDWCWGGKGGRPLWVWVLGGD